MEAHAIGVRINFSRGVQRRHFAYPVADDAMQMGVKQNALPFLHHKENALCITSTVTKIVLRWRCNASFHTV